MLNIQPATLRNTLEQLEQAVQDHLEWHAQLLRVIVCELNRISSHLIAFGSFTADMGAFTPFLYAIRERERVNDLFEMICGNRLTYNYARIGGGCTSGHGVCGIARLSPRSIRLAR